MAFHRMDPFGEYRADLRMARSLAFQCKTPPPLEDFVLFPDDKNDLPEDVSAHEQQWMLALSRNAGD